MDLGIVGNCQYSALIDRQGNVKWLCWPRFDSDFIFGSLLDSDKGGTFQISPGDGRLGEQSYVGNTNILRTTFRDEKGAFEVIDFAPRFMQSNRYYKPKMLVRIIRPLEGRPRCCVNIECRTNYGKDICSDSLESNHIEFFGRDAPVRLTTNAPLTYVKNGREFSVDRSFYFALTQGHPVEADLVETCQSFLVKTKQYWETWIKHSYLPPQFQNEVIRSALVLKLHQFEDTGAIIAATTTSIPEAGGTERNWDYRYCWIRDAVFSLSALQRLTHFEELEKFILYLNNIVEDSKDQDYFIQPVYGIGGEQDLSERILDYLEGYLGNKPVRIGNQAAEHLQYDVYGEILLAISPIFLDQRFLPEKCLLPISVVDRLTEQIEKYLVSPDAGLWEFRGKAQVHTFTLLLNWAGLLVSEKIYHSVGEAEKADSCRQLLTKLSEFIEKETWNEDISAYTQAADSTDLDASLLMLINMGYLEADDPKAHKLVDQIIKNLSHNNGLLHRYKAPDDFGATENAFLICSFWLVESLARLNRREEALSLLKSLMTCSNHLGLFSEDVDPATGTPWGNFPQTYSHVGLINAVFALFPHHGTLYLEKNRERQS
ncbi:MAG: glycoside hydrolase family 15 protein [Pseudobacteriovorax sp.]|nr:glycoside hydrolase family 15 protein [Pseudobacteriovorax sp.]